jgi:iron(III) transport system ATP-binding protein
LAFLDVQDLFFKYNENWVLDGLSFQANKGDLLAIVGPSGCGKTTLLRVLVGILSPNRGKVLVDQSDILTLQIEDRKIGYVPQNQALFPHLSVYGNLSFGLHSLQKEQIHERVLELARLGGLLKFLERRPHELSGGQAQRVALLRALAPSPHLMLLDEPLSNIDSHLREQLAMYIRKLQRQAATTTLFVTHDLQEAKMLADKLVIMNEGRTLQIGSPKEVNLQPNSLEVAMTLGLKNLIRIFTVTLNKQKKERIIETEIGAIHIPESNMILPPTPRGMHLDPLQLSVAKVQFDDSIPPNSFIGEIIGIVPEPMIHKSILLISLFGNSVSPEFPVNQQGSIIRVYIPLEDDNFQLDQKIIVKIDSNAITFYS